MPGDRGRRRDDDYDSHRPEDNPFIAFRRFVDDQFRTLLNMSSSSFEHPHCRSKARREAHNDEDLFLQLPLKEQDNRERPLKESRDRSDIGQCSPRSGSRRDDEVDPQRREDLENRIKRREMGPGEPLRTHHQEMWRDVDNFIRGWFGAEENDKSTSQRWDLLSNILDGRSVGMPFWSFLGGNRLGSDDCALQYLLFNHYSPLHLEFDDANAATKPIIPWRVAFEDLIRVQAHEKIMPQQQMLRVEKEDGMDWLARMSPKFIQTTDSPWEGIISISHGQSHGEEGQRKPLEQHDPTMPQITSIIDVLRMASGARWPFEIDDSTNRVGKSTHPDQYDEREVYEQQNPDTELDVYERLTKDCRRDKMGNAPQPRPNVTSKQPQAGVLSTLTTTEKTVAPDGTVTTKVVLKKRFADGREESSETIHTANGLLEEPKISTGPSDATPQHPPNGTGETKPSMPCKKRGWFWSS